jgi:hypothetical protein
MWRTGLRRKPCGRRHSPSCEENTVKLTLQRLLLVAVVVDVIAFAASGLLRNAHHGVGAVVGDIAWFTFLTATVCVLVLAVASIAGSAVRRRRISATR